MHHQPLKSADWHYRPSSSNLVIVRIGGLALHTSCVYIDECSPRPYRPVT